MNNDILNELSTNFIEYAVAVNTDRSIPDSACGLKHVARRILWAAFEKGYTAFGKTTMMQGKIAKFIVASNFCRFTYAVCKAIAFFFIIAGHIPSHYPHQEIVLQIGISYIPFCITMYTEFGILLTIGNVKFLKICNIT